MTRRHRSGDVDQQYAASAMIFTHLTRHAWIWRAIFVNEIQHKQRAAYIGCCAFASAGLYLYRPISCNISRSLCASGKRRWPTTGSFSQGLQHQLWCVRIDMQHRRRQKKIESAKASMLQENNFIQRQAKSTSGVSYVLLHQRRPNVSLLSSTKCPAKIVRGGMHWL